MLLILLLFAVACVFLMFFIGDNYNGERKTDNDSTNIHELYTKKEYYKHKRQNIYYNDVEIPKNNLFPFDPNTADSTTLLRLGLKPWQVKSIYRFRSRGGTYRRPIDFAKTYGMTVKQYKQLEPYIHISNDYLPAKTLFDDVDTVFYNKHKLKEDEYVVLNTSDTTMLKRVPGIGSYFAKAIVSYGKRLGGYVNTDQLSEIEGFPEESKKFFRVDLTVVKHINVNTMKLSEMRHHPYMGYFRAKAITEYRRLHGHINSIYDLSMDNTFTPEAIARILPYIEY